MEEKEWIKLEWIQETNRVLTRQISKDYSTIKAMKSTKSKLGLKEKPRMALE